MCPADCIIGPVPLSTLRQHDRAERKRLFPGVQMFIDPDECVDCGACVPECPQDAIVADCELPSASDDALRNAQFFRARSR